MLAPFEFAVKYPEVQLPHYDANDPNFSCHIPKKMSDIKKEEEQKASVKPAEVEKTEEVKQAPAETVAVEEKPKEEEKKPKEKKKLIDLMEDLTLA